MKNLGPLIVNIDGLTLSNTDKILLSDDLIGGVILFSNNYQSISQLKNLLNEIKELKSNILISIDHEGGRVQRFRKDFTNLPSFYQLANAVECDREKLSYYSGIIAGYELSQIGIDLNYSPVIDICENENNSLLSKRTFGNDESVIISLSSNYINGLMDSGVMPVMKHYPGHGLVNSDSHIEECVSDETEQSDKFCKHFSIFKELTQLYDIPIMTSHIRFKNIDEHIVTYSKKILNLINKNNRTFFISDDLEMHSAKIKNSIQITPSERIRLALDAGCSFLIVTTMLLDEIRIHNKTSEYLIENYLTDKVRNICKEIRLDKIPYSDFKYSNKQKKKPEELNNIYFEAKKNLSGII